MGQLIRSTVQLPVADALVAGYNGHGIRRARHLGLEQLGQARLTGVVGPGVIPRDDELMPLGFRQEWQA